VDRPSPDEERRFTALKLTAKKQKKNKKNGHRGENHRRHRQAKKCTCHSPNDVYLPPTHTTRSLSCHAVQ